MVRKTLILATAVLALSAPANALAYSQSQFDSVTTSDESQINRVRDQEIAQLKIVLGRRFSENRRPDILLRLAELYIEKYRYFFFKENQIHQELYKQGQRPKSVNHDRSREQLRSATNACLAILKSRVPFNKLDEVYYFLGYNAEEMGRKKEAAKYFEIVAKRYPNSSYAPEAYRNLAEHAFENKKYDQSLRYYERAAQFTKVPSYPRTLYKLAWAYFKNRRRTEALNTMKRVIELSGREEKFVGLRDEAMNDIVMFFSEAGRFKEAHDYFTSISGGAEVYVKALNKLSGVYERRGDEQLAIKVNESLISEYAEKRPDLIYDALGRNVELYRKLGDTAGEERALKRLVEYFTEHSGQIAKGEEGEATLARAKNYLRNRATEVHKEARKKKSPALYGRAAELYSLYIKAFLAKPRNDKEEREAVEIRTYRSDALLAAGRESDALPELERALKENGDAKYRRESGATLLNILIKRIDATRAAGKDTQALERQFVEASEAFEDAFPQDPLVAELRYKKARLAAAKSGPQGLNGDAKKALKELVEKYPGRAEAADAAHELVADLMKRGEKDDAVELAQVYLANRQLLAAGKKGDLEKYLREVVARSSFEQVQKVEQGSDFAKAAQEYERLARSQGATGEVVAKSLNNAAVNYERAGQVDEAVRVFMKMMADYPNNPAPKENIKRIAAQQLFKSQFAAASKLYAKLASMAAFSRDERMGFMHTAFQLDWGLGDHASAFLIGTRGLRELCEGGGVKKGKRRASKPSTAAPKTTPRAHSSTANDACHALALDLARLQIDAGRHQEALGQLRGYLARTSGARKAEANFMIAQLYQSLHEGRKATGYYEEAAKAAGHGGGASVRERNFAAHAAFLLVEPYFNRFASMKLELPEDKLKAVTRAKLRELESLVTRYVHVVAYGDGEWGIAALERLHDIFSGFAAELEGVPVPPKYEGPRADAYRRGIQQVTQPMHARAAEYLRQGYQKGIQLHVTTPTFIALTQRLGKRFSREFPPAHYAMVVSDGNKGKQSALRLAGATQADDVQDLRKPDHEWRRQVSAKLTQNPKAADAWVEFGNLEALSGRLKLARLMYEQAMSLAPKNPAALCNLSVILFLEQHPLESTQGLLKAAEVAEFNRDIKLNLAKSLLAYHHFGPALEHIRPLAARFPQDLEVQEALATALLGNAQLSGAHVKLQELDAEGSKRFTLWYNWSVWALLAGNKDQKEKALELLNDRRAGLGSLEQSQVDVALAMAKPGAGGGK